LEDIQKMLQCGRIQANDASGKRDKTLVYVVRDRKDLSHKIVPFFQRFQLQTEKRKDFDAFSQVVQMMENDDHLTWGGFQKIVELAYSMNANGRYRKRDIQDILQAPTSSETIR
jgi:hypothetical protein